MSACVHCGDPVGRFGYCDSCGMLAGPETPPPREGPEAAPSSGANGHGAVAPGADGRSDPLHRLMVDPVLPERRRWCHRCGHEVGRRTTRREGLVTGYCRGCGAAYSCRPPLQPDESTGEQVRVADRYDVLGAIGRGGLGWVYLARDTRVSRYVVLKGLLDPARRDLADEELRALTAADHPGVVTVHDFVQHAHPLGDGERETVDYLVMEYVHGESLLDRFRRRRQEGAHLAIGEAAELLLPALDALADMHERDLIHNDVKPDNVMVAESGRVFLVDLGAVSHSGGNHSSGTVGYRDPGGHAPSPLTDIYAIGRSLAALTIPIPDFAEDGPLPAPDDEPLLAEHESFRLLLERATDAEPERRFASVGELASQLRAVVREVGAVTDGPCPGESEIFGPEPRVVGAGAFPAPPASRTDWALSLPETQVDSTDPQVRRLITLRATGPRELLSAADALRAKTPETGLQAVRARIELLAVAVDAAGLDTAGPGPETGPETDAWARGRAALADEDVDTAEAAFGADTAAGGAAERARAVCAAYRHVGRELATLADQAPGDARIPWLEGVAALVLGAVARADDRFAEVLRRVPGEAAPKLGRGACAELLGDPVRAAERYRTVWRTDRSYLGAAFGLARSLLAQGDRRHAVEVLSQVPPTSRYSTTATLAALAAADPAAATDAELAPGFFRRADRLDRAHPESLEVDDLTRERAVVAALRVAAGWLANGRPWPTGRPEAEGGGPPPERLLGRPLEARALRAGIESAYRRMAATTHDPAQRIAWVDQANRERNWSIW